MLGGPHLLGRGVAAITIVIICFIEATIVIMHLVKTAAKVDLLALELDPNHHGGGRVVSEEAIVGSPLLLSFPHRGTSEDKIVAVEVDKNIRADPRADAIGKGRRGARSRMIFLPTSLVRRMQHMRVLVAIKPL